MRYFLGAINESNNEIHERIISTVNRMNASKERLVQISIDDENNLKISKVEQFSIPNNRILHLYSYDYSWSNYTDDLNSHISAFKNYNDQFVILGSIYSEPYCNSQYGIISFSNILMQEFNKKKEKAFETIDGDFIIVHWDKKKQIFHLYRDKMGLKALFYSYQKSSFYFSSDIRYLSQSGLMRNIANNQGVWNYLSFTAPTQPITMFADVKVLEKGKYVSVFEDKIDLFSYYNLPSFNSTISNLQDAKKSILTTLRNSIDITYQNNETKNIGSLLSGGVDSSFIVALLKEKGIKFPAITLSFTGDAEKEKGNEEHIAKMTAEKYDLPHIIKYVDQSYLSNIIDDAIRLNEQAGKQFAPFYISNLVAKKNNVEILYSGLGADELHGGFYYFQYLKMWRIVKHFPRLLGFSSKVIKDHRLKLIYKMSKAKDISEYYTQAFSSFTEDQKKSIYKKDNDYNTFKTISKVYGQPQGTNIGDINGLLYYMISNVQNQHMYKFGLFARYFDIKAIYPFLSQSHVEVAHSILPELKSHWTKRKIALKYAANDFIPLEAINLYKLGLSTPRTFYYSSLFKNRTADMLKYISNLPEFSNDIFNNYFEKPDKIKQTVKLVDLANWYKHHINN